jgi:hypothetical protein
LEEYRKLIKNRVIILAICIAGAVAIAASGMYLAWGGETDGSTYMDGLTKGFPCGLFIGFCALMLIYLIRMIRALQNESMLQKMYISENDERKKAIRQSALGMNFFITAGVLVIGVTISSYYNTIVAATLAAVLAVQALTGAILKLYYMRKY